MTHEQAGQVTLSVGVGELQPGETLAQLIERVDKAMYRAKHAGRNQVQPAAVVMPPAASGTGGEF